MFTVDIETKDNGFLDVHVTGRLEQAAAVTVHGPGTRSEHVIVSLAPDDAIPASSRLRALTAHFPARQVSLVLSQGDGQLSLISTYAEPSMLLAAAVAAATVKRSWGWDESPEIAVTFTAPPCRFVVNPVFLFGTWTVGSQIEG
jgi:hypothetical protein